MSGTRPPTVTRPELLIDGTDVDFRIFAHAFIVFSRRFESVRAHGAALVGVTPPQYEILSHLREARRGLTITEIAQQLHCSCPFVTTEAGKLHRAGFVLRNRDPLDARCVRLTLTPMCETRFREIAPVHQRLNDTLFASLTSRQFQILREVFPKLVDDGDRATALAEFQRVSPQNLKKKVG